MSQPTHRVEFEAKAKIGEVMGNLASIQLRPEDLSSPIAFQMAISRIYSELMNMMSSGPQSITLQKLDLTTPWEILWP